MEGVSTSSIIFIVFGGLFALAVILTAAGHILQWLSEVIEVLGYVLAMGIIKVLSFPFILPYKLYIRWRGKKTIIIPAPKPEPVTVRRRVITATISEEERTERQ